jgi:hypothetical protein
MRPVRKRKIVRVLSALSWAGLASALLVPIWWVLGDLEIKGRVGEATSLGWTAKDAVDNAYQKGISLGRLPDHQGLGLAAAASYTAYYVQSVSVDKKGIITVRMKDTPKLGDARNGIVRYTPTVEDDRLVWAAPECSFGRRLCPKK